jgi:hypothetical protein
MDSYAHFVPDTDDQSANKLAAFIDGVSAAASE